MAFRILTLLLPAALLLMGAFLLLALVPALSAAQQNTLALMPYLMAGIAGFLGYCFKHSRVLLVSINLCAAYFLIQNNLQSSLARPDNYVLYSFLSLLLPVNIALIATYAERGVFTPIGVIRLVVVSAGYLAIYILKEMGVLGYWLTELPISLIQMAVDETYLSEAAAMVFVVALIPVVLSLIFRRTHTDAGLLASLIAALVTLLWFERPLISSLFLSAALIALAVSVVQNSYNMAFVDELTGIFGRRALRDKFANLGRRYTVAMLDIDHFKKFNDTYGHETGDHVLRMVAAKINNVKGGGKAYRYGGEEFAVVFAGKTEDEVLPYLEEVREIIAYYPMAIRSEERPTDSDTGKQLRSNQKRPEHVQVTISIGVAEKDDSHSNPDAVMKSADQALYAAKKAGRNCTIGSHQPISVPRRVQLRRAKVDFVNREG
ncbi:sensor domain-containing diguanylate cyclase [Neptunomonas antarctica]|uniref:diguanylate cyclase n=1 Tax=Neptunomonas antarctica TaxID=619304 RepID=A0A1N7J2F6_9GAMM|nr:GGDEF domain-containing protein [Neptunomonas antarctica]SIS43548.1 diguanylate cyclase (GGDEF) domain-containing protein [Neptunomonas antarctica]